MTARRHDAMSACLHDGKNASLHPQEETRKCLSHALAQIRHLSADQRRRVLEHAIKVNDV
jgi:hypothetical protein